MKTYERIAFKPEGAKRAKSVILRDPTTNGRFLTGIEVDKYGTEISGPQFDERRHVIDLSAITRCTRLRWNLHYGELERDPNYAVQKGHNAS